LPPRGSGDGDLTPLTAAADRAVAQAVAARCTTRKIASLGQIAFQGTLVRKRCATFSMLPQQGEGGCYPSRKNDNAASAMIATAIGSVAGTISVYLAKMSTSGLELVVRRHLMAFAAFLCSRTHQRLLLAK
jgi:hypothetical protein